MALEEELSLEITQALQSIQQIEDSLSEVADTFKTSVESALSDISVSPEIDLQVNSEQLTAVEQSLDNLQGDVQIGISGEKEITDDIQHTLDATDFTITPEVDVSALEGQLEEVSGAVQDSGLSDLGDQAETTAGQMDGLGKSAFDVGSSLALVRTGSKLATGEGNALVGFLESAGGKASVAAATFTAFAIAGKHLFEGAKDSESAAQRFKLIFGDVADSVNNIDIGGLDESITSLAQRLGQDDEAFINAAAKIGTIGKASGALPEQLDKTTEGIIALAARAAALDPTMKNAGQQTQRLLFALARGGPALARFGIDIPVKELRDFATEQGKSFTSLSLFEKAGLGVDLAMQKLGGTLKNDINAGAGNITTQFKAIQEEFNNTLEDLGKPLLQPILDTVRSAQPLLIELAAAFAAILQAVLPLASVLVESLAPAIQTLTVLLSPLLTALASLGKLLGNPVLKPLVQVAAAMGLVAVAGPKLGGALRLIDSGLLKAGVSTGGLSANFAKLVPVAGAAAVGIIGVTTVLDALHKKEAAQVGNFIGEEKAKLATHAVTVEQMSKDLAIIIGQEKDLRETAKKNKSPFDSDYRHTLRQGADGLHEISDQYAQQIQLAKENAAATGLNVDKLLQMIVAGEDIGPVVAQAKVDQQIYNDALLGTESSMTKLIRSTEFGRDTTDEFNKVVEETGIKAEDLQPQLDAAAQAVDNFLQTFITGVPTLNSVLGSLDEKQSATVAGIEKGFRDQIEAAKKFQADLDILAQAGAVDALNFFSTAGPEQSGAALDALVAKGKGAITEFEGIVDEANSQSAQLQARKDALGRQDFTGLLTDQQQSRLDIEAKLHINLDDFSKEEQDFIIRTTVAGENAGKEQASAQAEAYNKEHTRSANAVESALDPLVEGARQAGVAAGVAAAAGFVTGFEDPEGIEASVVKLKNQITTIMNKIFIIKSPSKVTEDIGKLVAEGFVVGFSSGQTQAVEAAAELTTSVVDQFHLGIKDITETGGDELDGFIDRLKSAGAEVKAVQADPRVKNALEKQALAALKAGGLSADELKKLVEKQNNDALKAFAATGLSGDQAAALADAQKAQAIVSRIGLLQDVSAAPVVDVTSKDIQGRNDALSASIAAAATEAAVQAALAAAGATGPQVVIQELSIPNQGETPEETADTLSTVIEWSLQK